MTLKSAAFLALIGSILLTALLFYNLVFTILAVTRGVTAPVTLFSSLIYAFAALTVTVFFYVFNKTQV